MKLKLPALIIIFCLSGTLASFNPAAIRNHGAAGEDGPKIVNIVNFIRLLEPRDAAITRDVLYQTVVRQVEIMKQYNLPGTFLLQYDALMDPRYQQLLASLPKKSFEIGAWWELPQPLIEKAGLKWRGRYPWDWHADVGFATGYTPREREKITDIYMADFKKIFGYYPKTVACWFIDAHTLNYMYEKYHIVASANCKDQYGTDGYTLWGGYWNQAYYPSKINSYMPAQHAENQIPVPIFRMLGSDPIRQYDNGLGSRHQGVITLEPVYEFGGGDKDWVNWFFQSFTQDRSLGFNYTQAGQENSFTWKDMARGFEIQMPLIAKLRKEGKLKVETLEQSGRWFKNKYSITPATSFAVTRDIEGSDLKTLWYNSRFYRTNLLWENGGLRIRDIHMFNENFADKYTTQVASSNECSFYTLPVVDGYIWSLKDQVAGLRFKAIIDGREVFIQGKDPVFTDNGISAVHIFWPLTTVKGSLEIELKEKTMNIMLRCKQPLHWYLDLYAATTARLPFTDVNLKQVSCSFEGMNYAFKAEKGSFAKPYHSALWQLTPSANMIVLNLSDNSK
ncbi:MAG: hypothetical protein ABI707_17650 [Ferruginibacter sp.]